MTFQSDYDKKYGTNKNKLFTMNMDDLNKYEEKLFFNYAGLTYKFETSERTKYFKKENYFNQIWNYVLVFPNPDYEGKEKYYSINNSLNLYDFFFFPDNTETSFHQAKISENKIFDLIIKHKINDKTKNYCLINKGGCFHKSIFLINLF